VWLGEGRVDLIPAERFSHLPGRLRVLKGPWLVIVLPKSSTNTQHPGRLSEQLFKRKKPFFW
jgi:hypothetical protein